MKEIRDLNRPLGDLQLDVVLMRLEAGEELPGDPGTILRRLVLYNYREVERQRDSLGDACYRYIDTVKELRQQIQHLSNDRLAEFFSSALNAVISSPTSWGKTVRGEFRDDEEIDDYTETAMQIAQAMLKKFKAEAE